MTKVYVENDFLKVGVDTEAGCRVCSLIDKTNGNREFLDPLGGPPSEIGIFTGGWGDPFDSEATVPWNPNQSNCYDMSSDVRPIVNDFSADDVADIMTADVTPVEFERNYVEYGMNIQQEVSLLGNILKVKHTISNDLDRSARWEDFPLMVAGNGWDQNPWFLFWGAGLLDVVRYEGGSPWTGGALTKSTIPVLTGVQPIYPTEPWAALVDSSDTGVGVYAPGFPCFDHWWRNEDNNPARRSTALNPVVTHNFVANDVWTYEIYVTIGSVSDIRNRFEILANYGEPQPPTRPLFFATQPSIQSLLPTGATLAYGTADPDADDVTARATSFASATDMQIFREAASAIVSAGGSVADTRKMLESVFNSAAVAVTATSQVAQVEQLLAQIQAFPTVNDLLNLAAQVAAPFFFTAQPSLVMATGDGGIIAYGTADIGADDVTASATATVAISDILTCLESLVATVQAIPTVADLMSQLEAVTAAAQAEASVVDVKVSGVAESLLTSATTLAQSTDVQLMVDNVTIMAQSGASIGMIASYLETVASAATVQTRVSDVLTNQFIKIWLIVTLCRPRGFTDIALPRIFKNICSPRGRA